MIKSLYCIIGVVYFIIADHYVLIIVLYCIILPMSLFNLSTS